MGYNLSFGAVVDLNKYGGGGVVGDVGLNEYGGGGVVGVVGVVGDVGLNEYGGGCDLNENDGETNLSFDVVDGKPIIPVGGGI